ncbi:type II toxin-antitoxin system PemK/MazF family toxin [Lutibaculum baratangense]|uniref:PemK protein n=1 Tax=Lutibaculum baratangense AMV1 TaxID=631454 RepID=V4RIZ6_9HYPH|nr:type II toxin-antitoxin system PemK/MazF family toxin [Lutibaculum baratangense]ESR25294.1 PemK protein [Lutibaculum baratangense AMV1]
MRRGEIWHVDLNPTSGREQQGARYVLIVSPESFNRISGTAIVVPITTGGMGARMAGFAVSLTGAGTASTGVILCNQVRTLDLRARGGRRIEAVPDFIVDDVLARLSTLFE